MAKTYIFCECLWKSYNKHSNCCPETIWTNWKQMNYHESNSKINKMKKIYFWTGWSTFWSCSACSNCLPHYSSGMPANVSANRFFFIITWIRTSRKKKTGYDHQGTVSVIHQKYNIYEFMPFLSKCQLLIIIEDQLIN